MSKKITWASRQFSRFDLALTKLSRPLVALNTISNLSVALVVGVLVFGFLFLVGFLGLVVLGYGLHRSGFLMQTTIETFDQQQKELYRMNTRYFSAYMAKCMTMTPEELEKEFQEAKRDLRL